MREIIAWVEEWVANWVVEQETASSAVVAVVAAAQEQAEEALNPHAVEIAAAGETVEAAVWAILDHRV